MEDKKELCIIICAKCSSESNDHLASVKTFESWQTLFEAAQVRNHKPILEVAKQLLKKANS